MLATMPDAPDPLAVLEKLLGSEDNGVPQSYPENIATGDTLVDDFESELDFEGLNLRELVSPNTLHAQEELYTTQTVEQCMFQSIPTLAHSTDPVDS